MNNTLFGLKRNGTIHVITGTNIQSQIRSMNQKSTVFVNTPKKREPENHSYPGDQRPLHGEAVLLESVRRTK